MGQVKGVEKIWTERKDSCGILKAVVEVWASFISFQVL
jgi:hypothetical protein